jgi:ABC-type transport system substrate-binding protein
MAKIILIVLISCLVAINQTFAEGTSIRIPLHTTRITLDPTKVQDISSLWVSRQLNCQLLRVKKGIPALDVAQSITYKTPTLLDIKIKKNVHFSDGTELTADDVIATFDYLRIKRPKLRNFFNWIDQMQSNSKYELVIKLKRPIHEIIEVLATPNYAIFSKNFINAVTKDPSLWNNPVGCGDYKIESNTEAGLTLVPIKNKGLPLQFSYVPDSQVMVSDLDKYDIVAMQIMGKSKKINEFNLINVFDPFQYYFVMNTRVSPWNNRNNRCSFLAKIKSEGVVSVYGDRVKKADDFFPSGTIGYESNENNMKNIFSKYVNAPLPTKKSFCISFVASSIEKNYRNVYLDMIKQVYPNATAKLIKNYSYLNDEIKDQKCDGIIYAVKSNYLDAYEYLEPFAERGPSASGYFNNDIANKIKKSQEIDKSDIRAKAYQGIIDTIDRQCLMYPLFTMPYDMIYVRNTFNAVGVGDGAVNEYSLSNVQLKRM